MEAKTLQAFLDSHRKKCDGIKIKMIKTRNEIEQLENSNMNQFWEIFELSQKPYQNIIYAYKDEQINIDQEGFTKQLKFKIENEVKNKNKLSVSRTEQSTPVKQEVKLNRTYEVASMLKTKDSRIKILIKTRKLVARFHNEIGWKGKSIIVKKLKKRINGTVTKTPVIVCPECGKHGKVINSEDLSKELIDSYRKHVLNTHIKRRASHFL